MLKYFYKLFFQRELGRDVDNKAITITIQLGMFSTHRRALENDD